MMDPAEDRYPCDAAELLGHRTLSALQGLEILREKAFENQDGQSGNSHDRRASAGGQVASAKCPRLSHGKVILGRGKKRDIVALIKASNEGRLENLIPIRHGRMPPVSICVFSRDDPDTGA
jgi:hypothetical protein